MHVVLLGSGLSVEGHNMYYTEKSAVKVRLVYRESETKIINHLNSVTTVTNKM